MALNCWLQIEQVNLDCTKSDNDPLALTLRSLRFVTATYILFDLCYLSKSTKCSRVDKRPVALLLLLRHNVEIYDVFSVK